MLSFDFFGRSSGRDGSSLDYEEFMHIVPGFMYVCNARASRHGMYMINCFRIKINQRSSSAFIFARSSWACSKTGSSQPSSSLACTCEILCTFFLRHGKIIVWFVMVMLEIYRKRPPGLHPG